MNHFKRTGLVRIASALLVIAVLVTTVHSVAFPIAVANASTILVVKSDISGLMECQTLPEEALTAPQIDPQPISRDFDVFQPCGYSAEQLCYMLSDSAHQGLLPYVGTYLYAEETYGVNAFYLICKTGYESGWGKYRANTNNIGGWTNGTGGFMSFDSVDECILHIAEKLSTEYRDAVGNRLEDVCRRYCPTPGYTEMVMQIMREQTAVIEEMV